jgi:hypothetical protein
LGEDFGNGVGAVRGDEDVCGKGVGAVRGDVAESVREVVDSVRAVGARICGTRCRACGVGAVFGALPAVEPPRNGGSFCPEFTGGAVSVRRGRVGVFCAETAVNKLAAKKATEIILFIFLNSTGKIGEI